MNTYVKGPLAGQPKLNGTYICPADWEPYIELVQELEMTCPLVDQDAEFAKMRTHDFLRPYRNWQRAYRQWMNRAQRRLSAAQDENNGEDDAVA